MSHPSAVLYLTSGAPLTKVREDDQWVTQPTAPSNARWHIVTNLIDERFSRIDVPPMRRSDQRSFIQAQLANQFQGVTFRAALPYTSQLNKHQFILTGVGDSWIEQTIQTLADTDATIVGVWSLPTLLMNVLIRKRRRLPSTLLAMLPTPEGVRLLFVSDWQPVLTRLLSPDLDPDQLSQEILMTRRYLEDGKNIERQAILPLVVIGPPLDWTKGLESHQFKLLKASWGGRSATEVMNTLLDMALAEPPGQLAGLALRKHHVAQKIRHILIATTAAFSALGLLVFAGLAHASLSKLRLVGQAQAEMDAIQAKYQDASQRLAASTGQEALLLAAKHLFETELGLPDLVPAGLGRLSRALSDRPEVGLTRLEWRYADLGQACPAPAPASGGAVQAATAMDGTSAATAATAAAPAASGAGEGSPRQVVLEMRAGFAVPKLVSPLMAARQKDATTQGLQKQGGLEARFLEKSEGEEGSLVGGGPLVDNRQVQGKNTELSYCLSFAPKGKEP